MFKWVCLLVAVAALSVFGWMLNDIRLDVKGVTGKTEKVVDDLDRHLPRIISQTEKATATVDERLPSLLATVETTADNLDDLSERFAEYRDLMGGVNGAKPKEDLLTYGTGILDLLEGQKATIGVKNTAPAAAPAAGTGTPPAAELRRAVPAKAWAEKSRKDVRFLSLVAKSNPEVLHALCRSNSPAPLYIQLAEQAAPRLLEDWVREKMGGP